MEGPYWEGAPPPATGDIRYLKIAHVRASQPQNFTLLGNGIFGTVIHWDGCARVCRKEHDACGYCAVSRCPPRYAGYCAAWSYLWQDECVLSLPEGPAGQLMLLAEEQGGLRGLTIRIRRADDRGDSPLLVALLERRVSGLRPAWDVRPHLARRWRLPAGFRWAQHVHYWPGDAVEGGAP